MNGLIDMSVPIPIPVLAPPPLVSTSEQASLDVSGFSSLMRGIIQGVASLFASPPELAKHFDETKLKSLSDKELYQFRDWCEGEILRRHMEQGDPRRKILEGYIDQTANELRSRNQKTQAELRAREEVAPSNAQQGRSRDHSRSRDRRSHDGSNHDTPSPANDADRQGANPKAPDRASGEGGGYVQAPDPGQFQPKLPEKPYIFVPPPALPNIESFPALEGLDGFSTELPLVEPEKVGANSLPAAEIKEPDKKDSVVHQDSAADMADHNDTVTEAKTGPLVRPINGGLFAERLEDGTKLTVGGNILDQNVETKLELDFSNFDARIGNFSKEALEKGYDKNKEDVQKILSALHSDMDPYTFFVLAVVQNKVDQLMVVHHQHETKDKDRVQVYHEKGTPKLSDLVGKSQCAERAALAQYFLQKAGISSTYVGGIMMTDKEREDADDTAPHKHSYIILDNPNKKDISLVFDVTNPLAYKQREGEYYPRILEMDAKMSHELFAGEQAVMVAGTDTLTHRRSWYGAGKAVVSIRRRYMEKE